MRHKLLIGRVGIDDQTTCVRHHTRLADSIEQLIEKLFLPRRAPKMHETRKRPKYGQQPGKRHQRQRHHDGLRDNGLVV